jgi:hypothetical protein
VNKLFVGCVIVLVLASVGLAAGQEELSSAPAAPMTSPISLEAAEALPILIRARGDLELLADSALPTPGRPAGWSGSLDVSDPDLPLLIRLDLEILAGTLLAPEERPAGWFGVVPSSPLAVARDVRHDLELLADVVIGARGLRPGGWSGDDPLMRCNRATQALVPLLERIGFVLDIDFTQPDYCTDAEIQASRYVETQIIQPTFSVAGGVDGGGSLSGVAEPYRVSSNFVVAFLDRNARERIGVIPNGTGFRPIARSYADFSNMMLVRGEGFIVYVDYTTTDVPRAEFLALPNAETSGASPICSAAWCGR